MLGTMAGPEPAQKAARHYSQCLMRSRLTARELASFLREYVRARPELQGSSVQHAMNDYLHAYVDDQPIDGYLVIRSPRRRTAGTIREVLGKPQAVSGWCRLGWSISRTFARLNASKTAAATIRESSRLMRSLSRAAFPPCVLCASKTASEINLFRCVSFGILRVPALYLRL
jgi:hypothetical protein